MICCRLRITRRISFSSAPDSCCDQMQITFRTVGCESKAAVSSGTLLMIWFMVTWRNVVGLIRHAGKCSPAAAELGLMPAAPEEKRSFVFTETAERREQTFRIKRRFPVLLTKQWQPTTNAFTMNKGKNIKSNFTDSSFSDRLKSNCMQEQQMTTKYCCIFMLWGTAWNRLKTF